MGSEGTLVLLSGDLRIYLSDERIYCEDRKIGEKILECACE